MLWIVTLFTGVGWLTRGHTFKDKWLCLLEKPSTISSPSARSGACELRSAPSPGCLTNQEEGWRKPRLMAMCQEVSACKKIWRGSYSLLALHLPCICQRKELCKHPKEPMAQLGGCTAAPLTPWQGSDLLWLEEMRVTLSTELPRPKGILWHFTQAVTKSSMLHLWDLTLSQPPAV